jgi:hypothetical protein
MCTDYAGRMAALRAVLGDCAEGAKNIEGTGLFHIGETEYIVINDGDADLCARLEISLIPHTLGAEFVARTTGRGCDEVSALISNADDPARAVTRVINRTCGMRYFVSCAVDAFGAARLLRSELVGRSGEYGVYRRH